MSVSVSQCRGIAYDYMRENMEFEGKCICMPKAYNEEKQGRIVEVRFRETYLVMQLLVRDCGTVEVLKDRQEIIARIMQNKFQDSSELDDLQALHDSNTHNAFLAIVQISNQFPEWFKSVSLDEENGMKGNPEIALLMKGKNGKTALTWVKMARTKAIRARYYKRLAEPVRLRTITVVAAEVLQPEVFEDILMKRLKTLRTQLRL